MSKTAAERQRDKRKRDITENVTCHDVTPPEDAPQSTKSEAVVAERPARSRLVPIPGDADYVGCCHEVDGDWQVDNTKPPIKSMSTDELVRRLHYIKDWQHSLEHIEVQRRRRQEAAA